MLSNNAQQILNSKAFIRTKHNLLYAIGNTPQDAYSFGMSFEEFKSAIQELINNGYAKYNNLSQTSIRAL